MTRIWEKNNLNAFRVAILIVAISFLAFGSSTRIYAENIEKHTINSVQNKCGCILKSGNFSRKIIVQSLSKITNYVDIINPKQPISARKNNSNLFSSKIHNVEVIIPKSKIIPYSSATNLVQNLISYISSLKQIA